MSDSGSFLSGVFFLVLLGIPLVVLFYWVKTALHGAGEEHDTAQFEASLNYHDREILKLYRKRGEYQALERYRRFLRERWEAAERAKNVQ